MQSILNIYIENVLKKYNMIYIYMYLFIFDINKECFCGDSQSQYIYSRGKVENFYGNP